MKSFSSALYRGAVVHQRLAPKVHRLRYRMFQMLFDLDEIERLARSLRLFSHNKFNIFSFHDRDHGLGRTGALRDYVREALASAGIEIGGGKILLLCMPRLFGYVFNPISIYYCHRQDGVLAAMLYEVTNTYKERHSYLIPVRRDDGDAVIRQSCAKALFVSPFMDMAMTYDFTVSRPQGSVATTILAKDAAGCAMIVATFAGRRRALSDKTLAAALFAFPLLTLKVIAAIHWEAAKLFAKGVKLRAHPRAPEQALSIARAPRP